MSTSSPSPGDSHGATLSVAVHRIEIKVKDGLPDPRSAAVERAARGLGFHLSRARASRVYLIEGNLNTRAVETLRRRLLQDPVTEEAAIGISPPPADVQVLEVHPLPGVMDPAAQSVRDAAQELLSNRGDGLAVEVSTGWRFDLTGISPEQARDFAERALANPVVQAVHLTPWRPASLPKGHEYKLHVTNVPIRDLTDDQLVKLSREAHLFLSLEEMRAIRAEYRELQREPTDIEIETIAQTWSEHCVHKTLKSKVRYRRESLHEPDAIRWDTRPGHTLMPDGTVEIDNLLKSTVAAATHELVKDGIDWTLSVFKDNSGVIALDDEHGVCIKVETHNHPSAIEPYGGAATGAGGCIRDVIGTGLGAKPIANTDVFCVAFPDSWRANGSTPTGDAGGTPLLPPGTLDPRRVLTDVVAGVRDYGNRMGIPTLNGAVYFDDRHIGNPLVFCGCIGLIPRDKVFGGAKPGDRIVALGGRTGRDGIHGATFSSAELEHTAADEFSHAVQIGNAIEEKRLLDAILRARDEGDRPLYSGITDCGAGGFSSAVGEMGATLGAEVHLDRAPLKYSGLSYTEIWISEAQERMVLAVPPENMARLREICSEEHVELAELGHFGTPGASLQLHYRGTKVGEIPMHFLHEGIPTPTREASWAPSASSGTPPVRQSPASAPSVSSALLALLAHPNIASKHWIIRQYDHEVQGNTILKPLVGPGGRGPGDASVIEPKPGTGRGVAIGCGLQTGIGDPAVGGDPYLMVLAAIDECVRNLVCVGADPARTAILDNFCWPSCQDAPSMGLLVRAAEGCYDGAKAYRTPFVSGKDSLNNQFKIDDPATGRVTTIQIPPTLLITGIGIVPDVARVVTMDAKRAGNTLMLVGPRDARGMGGSHYARLFGTSDAGSAAFPVTDLTVGPAAARAVAHLISRGVVRAAHDVSDGGLLVALAEMLIGSGSGSPFVEGGKGEEILRRRDRVAPLGLRIDLPTADPAVAFGEAPCRYVIEVAPADAAAVKAACHKFNIDHVAIGTLTDDGVLNWSAAKLQSDVETLAAAWLKPLDW